MPLIIPPLAVYVHLPWCVRKCPYCDFNSHQLNGELPERRYVDALVLDLEAQAPEVVGRTVRTVFFGGGTPSLFSPQAIERVLTALRRTLDCDPDWEVTMEANPGAIERGRFADYRDAGLNRVSLGAQSFDDRCLKALGRIHSSEETRKAVCELHAAGLENFNLDLMYGLPEQSTQEAIEDVRAAIDLRPAHISHYQLTLEPGTHFARRPPQLPPEDVCWEMQLRCQALLAEHLFDQYEVSAYALSERQCRHNLNYWTFGDYLGLGAGAHGKLTGTDGLIVRTRHPRQPLRYMQALEAGASGLEKETVPPTQLPFEFMLNALRLVDGIEVDLYESRTGLPFSGIAGVVDTAVRRRLLERPDPGRLQPTALGLRFLNDLLGLFLTDGARTYRASAR